MEAELADKLPAGEGWLYEPKWDGFRCLAFRDGERVVLQSKSGQPLARYFPEVVRNLASLPLPRFVLDGEIVVIRNGRLSFDDLLQRIHPAASRVKLLSERTPASFLAFDLLVDARGRSLIDRPLLDRKEALGAFFSRIGSHPDLRRSPESADRATGVRWMRELADIGCDGVVAKRLAMDYRSGERTGMIKVKRARTADCVVGGFRYEQHGREIGSLLLGLYDENGLLDHVGFTSSFTASERRALKRVILPLAGGRGFTGRAPGGPSRWSTKRSAEWEPLRAELVCEVKFDHFSGGRFRQGTKFLRWRPDKSPGACTFEQLGTAPSRKTPFGFLRRAGGTR